MSSNTILRTNYNRCKTKSKKIKFQFIFNLDEIDKKSYSRSCEKKEIRNNFNQMEIINNNIFVIEDIDNLDILPLKSLNYIFSAWKSSKLILENFEQKILNKNDFEIKDDYDIKTKNMKARQELNDEKFWILYSEYLIKNNKIKKYEDFLKIINNAFSFLDCNFNLLLYYYFDKIKNYHPIIKGGKIEVKDESYIELLDTPVKNRIKNLRDSLKSDVKITSNRKQYINKHHFYEFTPIQKKYKKL